MLRRWTKTLRSRSRKVSYGTSIEYTRAFTFDVFIEEMTKYLSMKNADQVMMSDESEEVRMESLGFGLLSHLL